MLVLTVKLEAAVNIGVPEEPTLPKFVTEKLTVPVVIVTAPERVTAGLLLPPVAVRLTIPLAPVERFALIAIDVELNVALLRLTVAVPLMAIAPPTVIVPPETTVTGLVVPEIAPSVVVLESPLVVMLKDLAPKVIV